MLPPRPRRLILANYTHDDTPFQRRLIQIDGTADQQQACNKLQHRNNAGIPVYETFSSHVALHVVYNLQHPTLLSTVVFLPMSPP